PADPGGARGRSRWAALARDRDGRLLRGRGGADERGQAQRRATCARERPARRRRAADPGRGRRRRRRRRGPRLGPQRPRAAGAGARRRPDGDEPARRPDGARRGDPVRAVIVEDLALLRDGLTRLLADNGFEVIAAVADGSDFLRVAVTERPDVCVIDVRLPPTYRDEGLRAALEARARVPGLRVLVLSQYVEQAYARELLGD